jgi:hypothetical protein
MDTISLSWHDLADLSNDFCQIPQGDSVEIVMEDGRYFSYTSVINEVKAFAKLAGVKIRGVEPWRGGSYGFKFRTNLKKWVITICIDGNLDLS